jgi:hypothetical protein
VPPGVEVYRDLPEWPVDYDFTMRWYQQGMRAGKMAIQPVTIPTVQIFTHHPPPLTILHPPYSTALLTRRWIEGGPEEEQEADSRGVEGIQQAAAGDRATTAGEWCDRFGEQRLPREGP